jgi:hypothetical protein
MIFHSSTMVPMTSVNVEQCFLHYKNLLSVTDAVTIFKKLKYPFFHSVMLAM